MESSTKLKERGWIKYEKRLKDSKLKEWEKRKRDPLQ